MSDRTTAPRSEALALLHTFGRVQDKWGFLIVLSLEGGALRFNDLSTALPGIAPNVLTRRLRQLESEGLVATAAYQHRPPRLEYSLTESGTRLAAALHALVAWSGREMGFEGARHLTCGGPVETRAWCPTCEVPLEPGETEELWFL